MKSKSEKDLLSKLPTEIKVAILEQLPLSDVGSLRQVSQEWRDVTTTYGFWKKAHSLYFPLHAQNQISNDQAMEEVKLKISAERYTYNGKLVKKNAFLTTKTKKLSLPILLREFFFLTKSGSLEGLKKLPLTKEVFLSQNNEGFSPLDLAAYYKHQHLLDFFFKICLLHYKEASNFNAAEKLFYAFSNDDNDTKFKNPYQEDEQELTLFHWAILCRQEKIVRKLLNNAHVLRITNEGKQAIHLAAKWRLSILKVLLNDSDTWMLLDYEAPDINAEDGVNKTALSIAASAGDVETVNYLLQKNASLKTQNATRHTIFDTAHLENLELVQAILAHEPDSIFETSRLMLDGFRSRTGEDEECTIFVVATYRNNISLLVLLLSHEKVVNHPDGPLFREKCLNKLLKIASENFGHYTEMFRLLLALNETIPNSLIHNTIASSADHSPTMVKAILEKDPKQAYVTCRGGLPLEHAILYAKNTNSPCQNIKYEMVKSLLKHGAYSHCKQYHPEVLKKMNTWLNQKLKHTKIYTLFELEALVHKDSLSIFEKNKTVQLKKDAAKAIRSYLYDARPNSEILEPHLEVINRSRSLTKICNRLRIPLIKREEVEESSENIIISKEKNNA